MQLFESKSPDAKTLSAKDAQDPFKLATFILETHGASRHAEAAAVLNSAAEFARRAADQSTKPSLTQTASSAPAVSSSYKPPGTFMVVLSALFLSSAFMFRGLTKTKYWVYIKTVAATAFTVGVWRLLGFEGTFNIILLAGLICATVASGVFKQLALPAPMEQTSKQLKMQQVSARALDRTPAISLGPIASLCCAAGLTVWSYKQAATRLVKLAVQSDHHRLMAGLVSVLACLTLVSPQGTGAGILVSLTVAAVKQSKAGQLVDANQAGMPTVGLDSHKPVAAAATTAVVAASSPEQESGSSSASMTTRSESDFSVSSHG